MIIFTLCYINIEDYQARVVRSGGYFIRLNSREGCAIMIMEKMDF